MTDAAGAGPPAAPAPAAPPQPLAVSLEQTLWSGALPPPAAMRDYELILPGTMERILAMAELEQHAAIARAQNARAFLRDDVGRGHWLGFGLSALAIVAAVLCVALGAHWVAGLCLGVPVLAVAKALVDAGRQRGAAQD
jgi:uncharacterized membrane protein